MPPPSRERLIEKAKQRLLRHGLPRLEMSILLALTGASGFLVSFLLLKAGVDSMALRYPVAVMVAYGVFLLLLRVWLAIQRDGWRDVVDVPDADMVELALDGVTSVGRGAGGGFSGGGGSFGGAGSTTNFQAPAPLASSPPPAPMAVKSGGSKGFGIDLDFDLDEGGFLVLLAILILAVAVMGAAVYVLWTAPVLLAEVLVDGLIMTGLYRRLRKTEEPAHWLLGAVRRTWIPALAVAILFSIAGHLLQKAVPEARSIGPAVRAVMGAEA
jgi:hypothetical protein